MTDGEASGESLRSNPPSANEEAAKLRVQLRHRSLAELEADGIVNWDRKAKLVTKGPNFDETRSE